MAWQAIKERKRTYFATTGIKVSLHHVRWINLDETWIRTYSAEGLFMVNPKSLLGILVDLEKGDTINAPPRKKK